MIVLALDPGGRNMGYGLVRSAGPRVHYLRSGDVESTKAEGAKDGGGVAFAIEITHGYVYEPFRGPPLLEAARVTGGLEWLLEDYERPIEKLRADDVRATLLGKGFKSRKKDSTVTVDDKVRRAVETFVLGLPAKTSVHQRDALALAVVASWRVMNGRTGR